MNALRYTPELRVNVIEIIDLRCNNDLAVARWKEAQCWLIENGVRVTSSDDGNCITFQGPLTRTPVAVLSGKMTLISHNARPFLVVEFFWTRALLLFPLPVYVYFIYHIVFRSLADVPWIALSIGWAWTAIVGSALFRRMFIFSLKMGSLSDRP
jgi:hypothetical protein